jgi:2-polyprenyl-3-methyl-5-hydroxy-6-metoxy-1,4-benzoquinol methylase
VSREALALCAQNIAASQLPNVHIVDANVDPLGGARDKFEVVLTLDVLHDAPDPEALIAQVTD